MFEKTPDELKTLHYVAGGRYYLDGKAVDTKRTPISGETGKIALVVGATGVVGREILKLLLNEPSYDKIVVWTRRELEFSHKKLEVKLINFDEISKIPPQKIDEVFCALGTTIKKAGSKEVFLKIDVEYVEETAKWAKNAGARRFVLVSSPGANEGSLSFYCVLKDVLNGA